MVSTQASSSFRPESYADRAKGAQPGRPKNAPAAQQSQQSTTMISVPGAAANTHSVAFKPMSSPANETSTPSASQLNSVPPPLPAPTTATTNGDVNPTSADSASSAPKDEGASATNSAQKPAPSTTNVWNRRMEQMAQSRAKSSQASSQVTRPTPNPQDASATSQITTQSALPPNAVSRNTLQAPSASSPNGPTRHSEDDAFVVRPRARASGVDDIESWPEVGKAASSGSGQVDPESSAKTQERGSREGETAPGPTRKSASLLPELRPRLSPYVL